MTNSYTVAATFLGRTEALMPQIELIVQVGDCVINNMIFVNAVPHEFLSPKWPWVPQSHIDWSSHYGSVFPTLVASGATHS